MPFFCFYIIRTFRAKPIVKKGTMGGISSTKNKKVNWFKRSNKVILSWKKVKKILKIMLLSLFIERVFYSCEDIVCACDKLADLCSIETFDSGIILVFEMIVCLNNPQSMKRFQITQFEGYFNVARCNSVWQLFANSISMPCVERVLDKFLCRLIDSNIQRLELVHEIVLNNNPTHNCSLLIIVSFLRCLDPWKFSQAPSFWQINMER